MDSNSGNATQFREAYAREVRRGVLLSMVGLWILLALFIPNAAAQFFAKGADPFLPYRISTSLAVLFVLGAAAPLTFVWASRPREPLRWSVLFLLVGYAAFLQVSGFGWLPSAL